MKRRYKSLAASSEGEYVFFFVFVSFYFLGSNNLKANHKMKEKKTNWSKKYKTSEKNVDWERRNKKKKRKRKLALFERKFCFFGSFPQTKKTEKNLST